jgi:hypothetical protein
MSTENLNPDEATVFEQVRSALALIADGDKRAAAAVLGEVQRQAKGSASLGDGLDTPLWGAAAIGKAIGTNQRKAYHLLEHGLLPGNKIGKIWCSTKRKLLARIHGEDGWVPPPKPEPKAAPPTHVPKSRKKKLRPPPKPAEPPPRVARSRKRRLQPQPQRPGA